MYHLKTKNPSAYELKEEIAAAQEVLRQEPARKLIKYVKRAGDYKGEITDFTPKQYREIMGRAPKKVIVRRGKIPWEWALDEVATELGYHSDESLKKGIERALKLSHHIDDLKYDLKLAEEKEVGGLVSESMIRTRAACIAYSHSDWCKAKAIPFNGLEAIAIRRPASWSIHMVKEGETPSEDNTAGDVRYARDAEKALRDIIVGMETKYSKRSNLEQKEASENPRKLSAFTQILLGLAVVGGLVYLECKYGRV